MPKLGMEPIRKTALIKATIAEIGRQGTLDVTVGQIARRAGMSSALAHHYFGSKEQIFLAAMRHILARYGAAVRARLARAETPLARVHAIIDASFSPEQFDEEVISAWLLFYVQAQTSPEAARLLRVYAARLHSNLVHALGPLVPADEARAIARTLAALIDGFYIRTALPTGAPGPDETKQMLRTTLAALLEGRG